LIFLSRSFFDAIRSSTAISICLVGVGIIRFSVTLSSTFFLLWITSFIDSGVLKSENEAQTVYQKISIFSTIASCLVIPIAGKFADCYPPSLTIPVSFIARSVGTLSILLTTSPDSAMTYIMSALI